MTKYFYKRAIALITMVIVIVPTFAQLAVSAEEFEKIPIYAFWTQWNNDDSYIKFVHER